MFPPVIDQDDRAGRTENVAGHAPYYTVDSINLASVVEAIRPDDHTRLIAGFGPCRVGTKAQLFTMAASGYDAFEQPMKAAYRCLGQRLDPEPFRPSQPVSYLKETLGPYSTGESLFNPLSILRRATDEAWMTNQLQLIVLVRDPHDTWHSWCDVWEKKLKEAELFEHFVTAWETTLEIATAADESDLSIRVFDYELNREPEENYEKLFKQLDLDRKPVVDGWQQPDIQQRLNKHFIKFKEPEVFLPEGIRQHALDANGLHYQTYDIVETDHTDAIKERVEPVYHRLINEFPGSG